MFVQTAAKTVPAILDMMKVTSETDFEAFRVVSSATKKKINCFAVITPALAEAIQATNMTPASIFVKIVEQIKAIIPVPPEN